MHFSSIWPIDRTWSGATTPDQSGPGSDDNERVLRIPQSSSITGTSLLYCLGSYTGHLFGGGSYLSAKKQSVYSTAPVDCATHLTVCKQVINIQIELLVVDSNTWNHSTVCKQKINIQIELLVLNSNTYNDLTVSKQKSIFK